MYRILAISSLVLCFVVVTFGAYVRLSDAGLGCPDWPGCYGALTPSQATEEIQAAASAMPHGPVTLPKAWKEMIHRYMAGVLGLMIAAMMLMTWLKRAPKEVGIVLPTILSALVIVQALFGKWTVTLLLKPAIVTGHLIGGMLIFSVLTWQVCALRGPQKRKRTGLGLRLFALLALLAVAAQIILGGWVSTNYAALACTDFPLCHGAIKPGNMDFEHGFTIGRELGKTASGALLSRESLNAIHWTHRVGALIVSCIVGLFAWRLTRLKDWRTVGIGLFAILATQLALGIGNVILSLPLLLAVGHNGVAALLISKMVSINYRAWR
jgi:heme a synthase